MLLSQAEGFEEVYLFFKRLADIIISAAAMVILSPLFLAAAAAVKLTDGGHVIFCQQRMGLYGRPVKLYKFRTMIPGSENAENFLSPVQLDLYRREFQVEDDPRVTKTGRILREYSIDELPQLWNVLKGDLSLVGPRPITEAELDKYRDGGIRLLSVKPGLTGYRQAFFRNSSSYDSGSRQELELWYVQNRSAALDAKIFFKTFAVLLKKSGR